MPHEIKGIRAPLRPGTPQETRPSRGPTGPSPSRSFGVMGTDTVSITQAATSLTEADRHLSELPIIDAAKVGNIREAIADGNYAMSPQRIADKLVQFELTYNRAGSHVGLRFSA